MTNTPSIDIKNLSGQTVATAVVTEQAILHEELMAADYVQLSWNSDTGTTLPAGAYITVDGERYSLLEPYEPTRANEAEYQYAPQFQSRIMGWQKHPVPLYTYEEDGTTVKTREFDWDFTGSPADAMHMVQQAIKNETGEAWTVQLADSLPATISLSSQSSSIYAVLTDIANQCETEWWGDKATNTLYLAQCKHGTPVALTVGGNVGVPTVTAGKDGYFTRFYVFGSSRNVTQDSGAAATNSTVNRRLTLDPATYPGGYIDTKEGLQPGEIFTTTLYFDDIYPSAKLSISDVRARLKYRLDSNTSDKIQSGTDDEGNPIYEQYAIWYFRIAGFDFDPDSKIPNLNLSAHFETGQLGGRDFELTYHAEDDNRSYTDDAAPFQVHAGDYEIMLDESEGITIPGLAYIIPQDGDQVILYNIEMPAEYTASARQELAEAAQAEIARRTSDNNSYEMDSYPHTFATDGTDLTLGQAVAYTNGGTALSTRVLMVEKHLDFPAQQRIRVGNAIIKGNTQQLKEEVTQASQNIDILAAFNELSASLSNAYAKAQREMIEGFAAIKNMWKFDPDDPTVIYSDYSAYVNGYLSAKGNNPESGSTVAGASALVDLSDVDISNPQDGQILSWNGTKWVNADAPSAGLDETALAEYLTANHYAKTTDIPSLEGYATQTWASGQFALKTVAINAGTGLTGGGNLSASRTLSLATVGTAGTYTKVTVDAYGRVTGHASLAAGDIPALAISKITGLQDALDAKMDAADFEELFEKVYVSGYGYAIRAKLALYTDSWMSAKGSNPDAGSVSAGLDEEQLAEYLTEHGYATQSWVNQQGFLNSSALSGYATQQWVNSQGFAKDVKWSNLAGRPTPLINGTYFYDRQEDVTANWNNYDANGAYAAYVEAGSFDQSNAPSTSYYYGMLVSFNQGAKVAAQMYLPHNGVAPKFRVRFDGSWAGWATLALTTSKVADASHADSADSATTATRLQTARTLWGQTFNGTQNVSGALSNTGTITPSSNNAYALGSSSLRYRTVYANNGDFGNVVTAYEYVANNGNMLKYGQYSYQNVLSYKWADSVADCIVINIPGNSNHSQKMELMSGGIGGLRVTGNLVATGYVNASSYLQVGSARLYYDSSAGALYVQKSDGTSCGFYATGFISTKGANGNAGSAVVSGDYVQKSGDTMTGQLTISTDTLGTQLVINRGDSVSLPSVTYKNNAGILGRIGVGGEGNGSSYQQPCFSRGTSIELFQIWHEDNDGSGSGLDADLLDGTHKSGLFTAMTYLGSTLSLTIGGVRKSVNIETSAVIPTVSVSSSSSRNLSVNVGGSTDYVNDLYATYLGGTTKQGLFTGMTYSGNKLSVTVGGTTKSVTIKAGSNGGFQTSGEVTGNWNNYTTTGAYKAYTDIGSFNGANAPSTSYGYYGILLVFNNGETTLQVFIAQYNENRMQLRISYNWGSSWSSWKVTD